MPPSWFDSARRRLQQRLHHARAWVRRHYRSDVFAYRKLKDRSWRRLLDTATWLRVESGPLRQRVWEPVRPAFVRAHDEALRANAFIRRHEHESVAVAIAATVMLFAWTGYDLVKRPGDVFNPNASFQPQAGPQIKRSSAKRVDWPLFGGNLARTKFLPAKGVDPPFRVVWRYETGNLLEFPPIYAGGRLYGMNNSADLFALNARTGRKIWRKNVGSLNASSPAYSKGRLFGVNLSPGQAFAARAVDGRIIWRHPLPGRAESSPAVDGDRVYFGCECGSLFALDARSGRTIWSTQLGGAIKGGPALYHGVLYVGDYAGHMSAVRASNGSIVWQTGSLGASFGRSGEFYSTPAVAYGRVYAGNNDGRIYSFQQSNGALAWSHSLGGYVYSGPGGRTGDGPPPTANVGSFGGSLYALDARTGAQRWAAPAGGRVSGAISVIGNTAYVSNIESNAFRTYGFDIRSGRRVGSFRHGQYTPAISDGRWVYLTGYSSVEALEPAHKRRHKGKG
jgi:outer membrane protein assembly factor BamB